MKQQQGRRVREIPWNRSKMSWDLTLGKANKTTTENRFAETFLQRNWNALPQFARWQTWILHEGHAVPNCHSSAARSSSHLLYASALPEFVPTPLHRPWPATASVVRYIQCMKRMTQFWAENFWQIIFHPRPQCRKHTQSKMQAG